MTATTETLVPMMAATAAAVLVAYIVGSPPIYESLRERMPDEASIERRGNAISQRRTEISVQARFGNARLNRRTCMQLSHA